MTAARSAYKSRRNWLKKKSARLLTAMGTKDLLPSLILSTEQRHKRRQRKERKFIMSAINYLFDSWSFKLPLPAPFEGINKRQTAVSKRSPGIATSTLHGPTLKALIWYDKLMREGKGPDNANGQMAAYGTKDGRFEVAEILPGDPSKHCRCVVIDTTSGSLFGTRYDVATDISEAYELGPSKDDGAAVVFAALTMLMKSDDELREKFFEFTNNFDGGIPSEKCIECATICCDNIYRTLNDPNSPVKVASSNLGKLTPMAIAGGAYAPDRVVYGEFNYLLNNNGSTPSAAIKPVIQLNKFVGKYKLSNRELSDKEKALVPELADWYVIPKEIETVCQHAQLTTGCPMAMRNFLLRGPAGTGKTEGAKAVAAGMSLPYVKYTCSANSEVYDFIGQVIPVMNDKGNESGTDQTVSDYNSPIFTGTDIANQLELPSYMEIRNDPITAYEEITGTTKDEVTPEECYAAAIRKVAAAMQSMTTSSNGAQQYRYVETPFIKAIKNGYLCEVQEPTVIIQPGVLVGLNGLLDPDGDIFLPTGETIKRHPDAVIVVTTNTDYAGCRDMNQSVISRMHLVIDMLEPDEDIMTQRVLNLTGCQDEEMVRKMVGVVHSIEKYCQENDISDGTCGIRELTAWVISTDKITHNPYESALSTIMSKASADPESQESIRTNCLLPVFSKKTRQRKTA